MTATERRLLIWCAVMLMRIAPLSSDEAEEINREISRLLLHRDTRAQAILEMAPARVRAGGERQQRS